jgi:predicted nuclease of predicted toxin-antitoxin system
VRFLLDNDIDAAVAPMLRRHGHECWTARDAGLAAAPDDALTIWATSHDAALVSTAFNHQRQSKSEWTSSS